MNRPQRLNSNATRLFCLLAALLLTALSSRAQSLDVNAPAPVRSNTVVGQIAARDLGDSRMTDHYYAVTGTPGDLLITVQAQNLNGDIDVFTAGTLRPLLKLTLYAEISTPVTKSVYLRKREDLILRIEARSPNDDQGTYRLFFGGSFEPIVGGPDVAENETPSLSKTETPAPGGRRTKRVNSVGATIAEPEPSPAEVAAAPTPEPTPEAKPIESPKPVEKPAETAGTAKPAAPPRTPRSRKAPPRRVGTTARAPKETTRQPAGTARTTETTRPPAETPKPEAEPEVGPRLVIETNDGTLINRPMSGVRRVTVENGQVVVVGRDGKIDRILLANVVRMTIAP
jgi:hypothetical protein